MDDEDAGHVTPPRDAPRPVQKWAGYPGGFGGYPGSVGAQDGRSEWRTAPVGGLSGPLAILTVAAAAGVPIYGLARCKRRVAYSQRAGRHVVRRPGARTLLGMVLSAPAASKLPDRVARILLATDLSAISERATHEAFLTARQTGAQLLVVSVIDASTLRLPGGRFFARVDQIRERRQAAAQELVARGRREGVRVEFLVWEGEPGESILEAARAEDVDLIVIGSHGRGPIGRRILGSVSQYVVRHATVPVIVVPRDGGGAS